MTDKLQEIAYPQWQRDAVRIGAPALGALAEHDAPTGVLSAYYPTHY
ncbi:hypothetical protein [Paraburkholderia sp.]